MTATGDWVPDVTHEAMVRLLAHAKKVGLTNTEESTFRAMFMAAAHDLLDAPQFQTEWKKFDLLLQVGGVATIIEFKYYMVRRTVVPPEIADRRLVLIYHRTQDSPSRYSFHRSYGDLAAGADIAEVWRLAVDPLEARVLRPRPA